MTGISDNQRRVDATQSLIEAREAWQEAESARELATVKRDIAVLRATMANMTRREVGEILELTPARVQQILARLDWPD